MSQVELAQAVSLIRADLCWKNEMASRLSTSESPWIEAQIEESIRQSEIALLRALKRAQPWAGAWG